MNAPQTYWPLSLTLLACIASALAVGCGSSEPSAPPPVALPGATPGTTPVADAAVGPGIVRGDAGAPTGSTGPLPPLAKDVVLAPEFASAYTVFDLGPIPGLENGGVLLGCAVMNDARDFVLVSTEVSPGAAAGIYKVKIQRDASGHIYGFSGSASLMASGKAMSLVYGPGGDLFATIFDPPAAASSYPFTFLELAPGASSAQPTPLPVMSLGNGLEMATSFAFVPSGLADPGGTRVVYTRYAWNGANYAWVSHWSELATSYQGAMATFGSLTDLAELPGQDYGFAYVPAGSPAFPRPALMVQGYVNPTSLDRAWSYEVDAQGTPQPNQRRLFLSATVDTVAIWGLHFEPTTGDYLFAGINHLYEVRGFVPPPPLPAPK
jgi:hypothetical protein